MDIKQLEYFLVIAEEGQLTAAARRLYMSQPPLSYQLKNMEEELGTELFERGSRKMTLTPAGQILKDGATQILELTKNVMKELEDYGNGAGGTLSIGIVSSLLQTLFPGIIRRFHEMYPQVKFNMIEGSTPDMVEHLLSDAVEIAVIRIPFNSNKLEHLSCDLYDFEHYISREEYMAAVMHRDDDCFPDLQEITLDALKDKPLIYCRRFQSLISSACFRCGYEPHTVCVCDDTRNSVLWAENHMGITLAHSNAVNWSSHPQLVAKMIRDPMLLTKQVFLWRKDKYISTIARNFLRIVTQPGPYAEDTLSGGANKTG